LEVWKRRAQERQLAGSGVIEPDERR